MHAAGRRSAGARSSIGAVVLGLCAGLTGSVWGAEAGAEALLRSGRYAEAAEVARRVLMRAPRDLDAHLTLLAALEAEGKIDAAKAAAAALDEEHPRRFPALIAVYELARRTGDERRLASLRQRLRALLADPEARSTRAADLVAAGQAALALGEDAKAVKTTYFDAALRSEPTLRQAHLAAGRLALAKHDDALAARHFRQGLEKVGPDADLLVGLAQAFVAGDRKELERALDAALQLNDRHVPAWLLRAEHALDGEDMGAARAALARARAVDPENPLAWAYEAVLAHLASDPAGETRARARALARWPKNPEVDTLIGRKLSDKYRFAEGALAARRALALDPGHLPAKIRLAQDLLRLGDEREGWALAGEVRARDPYDIEAWNLVELRKHVEAMHVARADGFLLRMAPREAAVWGDEALALLRQARKTLDARWGFRPARETAVEVFEEQSDFAVRTFGLPGGAGYLGVCFGNLITANSPSGSMGTVFNWQAVLWHEYTHVITLGLTRNRMPRWLSEGISVWEERRRDPRFGQVMTTRYKGLVAEGALVPIAKLSAAFLAPKTPEHLVFAYYESSLVVEMVVERWGFPALVAVLGDLGRGVPVERALAAHTAPMPELERTFEAFVRAKVDATAPEADLARPEPASPVEDAAVDKWLAQHPKSLWAWRARAVARAAAGDQRGARDAWKMVVTLDPTDRAPEGAWMQLALAHRALGETVDERRALETLVGLAADAPVALRRLLELSADDPAAAGRFGEALLAVLPMSVDARRAVARRAERAGEETGAVAAYRTLLALGPPDAADVHLRLGRLLAKRDRKAARRHVMDALVEAPRSKPAQRLLLELAGTP